MPNSAYIRFCRGQIILQRPDHRAASWLTIRVPAGLRLPLALRPHVGTGVNAGKQSIQGALPVGSTARSAINYVVLLSVAIVKDSPGGKLLASS